jgi:hypothetical protein
MAWAPAYASLADLKASVRVTDTDDDAELLYALNAASRVVDHYTGRQFGALEDAAARYFSAYYHHELGRWVVDIDDLQTTTDLVVKTNDADDGAFGDPLVLDTDFRLYPLNAAADGAPWTQLVAASGTTFPTRQRSVEVTARWGWQAIPAVVVQATLIQAARFFKRRDAAFGVAGSPELGSELRLLSRLDPDVAVLLQPVSRWRPFA